MKRPVVIAGALVVGVVALVLYLRQLPPSGIEPMDSESATVQWVALATAIVSLSTALIGLAKMILERRQTTEE